MAKRQFIQIRKLLQKYFEKNGEQSFEKIKQHVNKELTPHGTTSHSLGMILHRMDGVELKEKERKSYLGNTTALCGVWGLK